MHATASDDDGADGTTGFQTGEEHDLRSFKKMLLGAVTAMVVVAVLAVGSASAARRRPRRAGRCRPWGTHAGSQRAVSRLAGRARAPRGAATTAMPFPRGRHGDAGCSMDPLNWPVFQPAAGLGSRSRSSNGCAIGDLDLAEGRRRIHQAHRARRRRHRRTSSRSSSSWAGWSSASRSSRRRRRRQRGDFCNEPEASTRSRRSRSGCSARTRTAGTLTRSSIRGIASQVTVKGTLPLEADFSEWGLGRSPDAARRLGQAGPPWRRARPATANIARRDDQLGHPRRLAADRGSHDHDPLGKQCPAETDPVEEIYNDFDAVDNCTGAAARAGGFSTVFGSRRAPATRSARSIRSTRTTRCSPTARSTRVTRRCRPRRST